MFSFWTHPNSQSLQDQQQRPGGRGGGRPLIINEHLAGDDSEEGEEGVFVGDRRASQPEGKGKEPCV